MHRASIWRFLGLGLALSSVVWAKDNPLVLTLQIHGTRRPVHLETQAGEPLDLVRVERDVRRLWATGWFEDIRVESEDFSRGVQLTFDVVEKPRCFLRQIRFEPGRERHAVDLEKGSPLDAVIAARVAAKLQHELVEEGFREARVQPKFIPAGLGKADLLLKVDRGPHFEIDEVRFSGHLGLNPKELRNTLVATKPLQLLPSFGRVWSGWRLLAPLSDARVESDAERLRALYISRGFFDARVEVAESKVTNEKARITFRVGAGARYNVQQLEFAGGGPGRPIPTKPGGEWFTKELRSCLNRARDQSEKRGELSFSPWIEVRLVAGHRNRLAAVGAAPSESSSAEPSVALLAGFEPGTAFHVGRIGFRGNRVVSDATLRKALRLEEGQLFDARRLRRSVARLNRIAAIQRLELSDVRVEPDAERHVVNLSFPARERPRGYWALSGPLGPVAALGPLQYTIGSRLPGAGQGLFESATYYATFSLAAWPLPFTGVFPFRPGSRWQAVFALQRPYLPGQSWQSGFLIAPQLGWRGAAAGYGIPHATEAVRSALGGDSMPRPELAISVSWRTQTSNDASRAIPLGYLQCREPTTRWSRLRSAGITITEWAMSWLLTVGRF